MKRRSTYGAAHTERGWVVRSVDEENENYVAVESEETLDAVYAIFKERYKDVLEFED